MSPNSKSFSQRHIVTLLLALLGSLLPSATAYPQTVWTNPGTGNWFDLNNWSNGIPTIISDVTINDGTSIVDQPGGKSRQILLGTTSEADGELNISQSELSIDSTTSPLAKTALFLGVNGSGSMAISDGGELISNIFTVGDIPNSVVGSHEGSHGSVVVSGAGSLWKSNWYLVFGDSGAADVTLSNGGAIESRYFSILAAQTGSVANMTITGNGSVWRNVGPVTLGGRGAAELLITNGGQLQTRYYETSGRKEDTIGKDADSSGIVTVTGEGSIWNSEWDVTIAEYGHGELHILEGGSVTSGTQNSFLNVAQGVGSSSKIVVDGENTRWNILANTARFAYGGIAELTITHGGEVSAKHIEFGGRNGSAQILVTDPGSQLISSHLGIFGNSKLSITNGARVQNSVSTTDVGDGGTVSISQLGSIWDTGAFSVAETGTGSLQIEEGAIVNARAVSIGGFGTGNGNVMVTGNGSKLTTTSMTVGDNAKAALIIDKQATVVSSSTARIGRSSNANGSVNVDGENTSWTISSDLTVGERGTGDLVIRNGAKVSNVVGRIGSGTPARGTVTVIGQGSTWNNSGALFIGGGAIGVSDSNGRGFLTIADGGYVSSSGGMIGDAPSFGTLLVTGEKSEWSNSGSLVIGDWWFSSGQMTIENGGKVSNTNATMATQELSKATAIVSGDGSNWIIGGDLTVGQLGNADLTIQSGALVTNHRATLATEEEATATATISGLGTYWQNSSTLTVGQFGKGTLSVLDGAEVISESGVVSTGPNGNGTVSIRGEGSEWNAGSGLFIAYLGGTGRVTISDNALLTVNEVRFGIGATLITQTGGTLEGYVNLSRGGTLRNNGVVVGDIDVTNNGKLFGSGVFDGLVTIGDKGSFSPGNSPGLAVMEETVWGAGGTYTWEINALAGTGGQEGSSKGWDFWDIGDLGIDGLFTVKVTSLTSGNRAGQLAGFNPHYSQEWRIAAADNDAFVSLDNLKLDTTGFANVLDGGAFSLFATADGRDLYVKFTAVPETSTLLLSTLGGLALFVHCRRSTRSARR